MEVGQTTPQPPVSETVRVYRLRVGQLNHSITRLFAARNSHFLEFSLGATFQVAHDLDSGFSPAPEIALVGTQSLGPIRLQMAGFIRSFTVCFRPAGMSRLFGLPMHELAGRGLPAEAVLGGWVRSMHEELGAARNLHQMAAIADRHLRPFTERGHPVIEPSWDLGRILERSVLRRQPLSVDELAEAISVSPRTLDRHFRQWIGVPPKRYLRVARMHLALERRSQCPNLSWGQIAADVGYYDQMHLVHDLKALGSEPPQRLWEAMRPPVPEPHMTGIY